MPLEVVLTPDDFQPLYDDNNLKVMMAEAKLCSTEASPRCSGQCPACPMPCPAALT